MPGLPWYCPGRGTPPFKMKDWAFFVVTRSKQGVSVGTGDGNTAVLMDEDELQLVSVLVPETKTVAGAGPETGADQLILAWSVPCPEATVPDEADHVKIQAGSGGVK